MTSIDMDTGNSIDFYIKAVLGRKAINIVALDIAKLTSFADVFIICSGRSNRQVSAIAEFISLFLKQHGIMPLSVEGMKDGHWVVLDYGHVIIHVFLESIREFYDLEGLWIDAKRIKIDKIVDSNQDETEMMENDE